MADNAQKTSLGRSIDRFTNAVANKTIGILGKSLPASVVKIMGAIVEVNYAIAGDQTIPNTTMPILGSRYYRAPIQPNELGVTLTADAYLGGVSGIGGGTADTTTRGNLSMSAWSPIGNKGWPAVDPDVNVVTGGPNGTLIRSSEAAGSTIAMTETGIVFTVGASSITLSNTGVSIVGTLTDNGHDVGDTHLHTKVQTGGALSGPPQ